MTIHRAMVMPYFYPVSCLQVNNPLSKFTQCAALLYFLCKLPHVLTLRHFEIIIWLSSTFKSDLTQTLFMVNNYSIRYVIIFAASILHHFMKNVVQSNCSSCYCQCVIATALRSDQYRQTGSYIHMNIQGCLLHFLGSI